MRMMGLIFAALIVAVLGLMAFVRLAPDDPARWHVAQDGAGWAKAPWDAVLSETGAARLRLSAAKAAPVDLLARLDDMALATPRTRRLAGSVAEGRITYVTRSALWGFPDYTTAEAREDGLYIHARLRFGREDMGVNADRLRAWLAAM
ncbi:MAG: DUF1499 domain-containing protein [Pseudotabrizicola sp.]|uniref:DUF1499 domain-containing protein n=1 Tax=Pseudotabrizicola sp. TaxID=2939647 RepID=UPI0027267973|nr:DUF1499 domain-containing protein [Pseudotabrizicola sp.]MDO9637656.1 DUF1499 domain-containing protein [Pseudotabrizicola sp.]